MIKSNKDKLVMQSVIGRIHSPMMGSNPYRLSNTGESMVLPATGGITYNYAIGDSCMDLVGDHVEPGVSLKNPDTLENNALNLLSCIGNEARVVSGEATGAKGYVTGTHGGIEHVMVYFEDDILDLLSIEDRIQIKAYGQGLKLEDVNVKVMNLDPNLMEKLNLKIINDTLEVPVVTEIPAKLLGSGVGSTAYKGDYDIMTGDKTANEKYGINNLRFGDLVLLKDADNEQGRQYLKGAVTIGVIVHSNCIKSGHGPGVTTIFTSREGKIIPRLDKEANIAKYLGVK